MNKLFLGIDLGTSSVKVLATDLTDTVFRRSIPYAESGPKGWCAAVTQALHGAELREVCAIGLTAQVGTYIVNGKTVLSWQEGVGAAELEELRARYPAAVFRRELGMDHPPIHTYPLPRLLYSKRKFPRIVSLCQPKELICQFLIGSWVSDPYSWRGLANYETCRYSTFFLTELGISLEVLPPLRGCFSQVGQVTEMAARETGLPAGIPVYNGMNDFYCSLMGMGIGTPGDLFDATGTSEHVGVVRAEAPPGGGLSATPYFDHFVHYGVNGSSGAALNFGRRVFDLNGLSLRDCLANRPPVFLPYLKGERAPILDSKARGVFFGIETDTDAKALAYSVLEGCAFSAYHIYETLGQPPGNRAVISGGAGRNELLNTLKAELFNRELYTLAEPDATALGAALTAASGQLGQSWQRLTQTVCRPQTRFRPEGLRPRLLERYQLYKSLYPALKGQFQAFNNLT